MPSGIHQSHSTGQSSHLSVSSRPGGIIFRTTTASASIGSRATRYSNDGAASLSTRSRGSGRGGSHNKRGVVLQSIPLTPTGSHTLASSRSQPSDSVISARMTTEERIAQGSVRSQANSRPILARDASGRSIRSNLEGIRDDCSSIRDSDSHRLAQELQASLAASSSECDGPVDLHASSANGRSNAASMPPPDSEHRPSRSVEQGGGIPE